jgi:hypothetical protein
MATKEQRREWALNWYYKVRQQGRCASCGKDGAKGTYCEQCKFERGWGPSHFQTCAKCRKRRFNWTMTDSQLCRFCRRDRRVKSL